MAAVETEDSSRRTGGPGALKKAKAQVMMTQPFVGASVPLGLHWKLRGRGRKQRSGKREDRKSKGLTTEPTARCSGVLLQVEDSCASTSVFSKLSPHGHLSSSFGSFPYLLFPSLRFFELSESHVLVGQGH